VIRFVSDAVMDLIRQIAKRIQAILYHPCRSATQDLEGAPRLPDTDRPRGAHETFIADPKLRESDSAS
jgi:hypothetical protein